MDQKLYLGLVHFPIKNKRGELITTSVTNMDIHDISRSCRTFGVERYFIVTPLAIQHQLVQRILDHWQQDRNAAYNPDRNEALSIAKLENSVEDAIQHIEKTHGVKPLLVVTGAQLSQQLSSEKDLRVKMEIDKRPCLLLFGTGWGLHQDILSKADLALYPIAGMAEDGYNHLSVRSAVAIYLDRLARVPDA